MAGEAPALAATVKYNPHLWGPAELRAIFVVRTRELQGLLERLRGTAPDTMPQHLLITGARGMGKTTLLRRLALAVEDDPELAARWLPLAFPEEQYTVGTLAELWRNVLDALADARERQGAPAAELDTLDREIARLGALPPEEREAAALASLGDWIEANDRRLLLLIDGTDLLLANLARTAGRSRVDGRASPLWRLRATLSHDPGIFWLGASYQVLESNHAYRDAFWDFFEQVELHPLEIVEMRQAMLALARTFGAGRGLTGVAAEQEMARTLEARPERLKALRAITGGNPRTTVMLYELFAAGGADDVHSDLGRLLDTMTPLYKARMETLSDQARKLLAHLMAHWTPIAARRLGEVSGIATNTASGQLTRLEAEGLVEKARLPGTRHTGYQAAERLFNVWYLMRYASRHQRQRLAWLVEFMRLWYGSEELTQFARSRAAEHAMDHLDGSDRLESSCAPSLAQPDDHANCRHLDWAIFGAARQIADRTRAALSGLFDLDGEDRGYTTAEDYLKRFDALDEPLAHCPHASEETRRQWIELVKGSLSLGLAEKEAVAQAAAGLDGATYREHLTAFEDEWRGWTKGYGEVAARAVREATLEGQFFPDCPDSRLAYNQVMGCFGEDADGFRVALDLFMRRHWDAWLAKALRHAIARDRGNVRHWYNLGLFLADQPGSRREAEAAYRQAIELDPKAPWTWVNLGSLLATQPEHAGEAETAYRQAIDLAPTFALPFLNLGNLLAAQPGRAKEAEASYRRYIELEPQRAHPWNDLGNLLADQPGRGEEAEAAYRQAIGLNPNDVWPWNNLSRLLAERLGRPQEAEAACRRAMELDPLAPYPVANLARLLAAQGRHPEAEAAYRQAVTLAQAADDSTDAPQTPPLVQGLGHAHLLLQAHLWLGNRDLARQALDQLAEAAAAGDRGAFFRLKEQARECRDIGLGPALRNLMREGAWTDFLQPFALALGAGAADDIEEALAGIPPELRTLAEEVLAGLIPPSGPAAGQ